MHGTNIPAGTQRAIRRHPDEWTLREHKVVVSYWPDIATILKHLPHRTESGVRTFASKCNLTRDQIPWTAASDSKMKKMAAQGRSRAEIAKELGCDARRIDRRLKYTGVRLQPQAPAPNSDPLIHAVRQRTFALKMTLADLDRSLGDRIIFQKSGRGQRVKIDHIERAIKALGGKLVVEWEEE